MSSPKSVFITGASGGLGRGLALHYAREGATVHAAARRKDELEKLARESPNIVPVPLDVQDTDKLVLALHRAEPLDMVIANAGIGMETPAEAPSSRNSARGTRSRTRSSSSGLVTTEPGGVSGRRR